MIRMLANNFRSIVNYTKWLQPTNSASAIVKRFNSAEIPVNRQKMSLENDREFDQIKRQSQAEVYLWHSLGHRCINPELVTEQQWDHLYGLDTITQRKKYLKFLLIRSENKATQEAWAEQQREESKVRQEICLAERKTNPHIVYGLGHNTLLLRFSKRHINSLLNMKLIRAKLYGQKIILDCSYDQYMTHHEHKKFASGLKRLFSENRKHKKPLDLHICGAQPDSALMKQIISQLPALLNKGSPTSVHSQCFTEHFPKERLVMLTPHSYDVLDYNSNDIYIIGGIVDMGKNEPLTLSKAKKFGIRTARLPLDDFRMVPGDSRELPASSVAAFIRELQINKNINEVIDKCVYLNSKVRKEREEKERLRETASEKKK